MASSMISAGPAMAITYQIGETRHINARPSSLRNSVLLAYLQVKNKAVMDGAKVSQCDEDKRWNGQREMQILSDQKR